MKLFQLTNFIKVYAVLKDQQINIKTAYKLSKIAQEAQMNLEFYREQLSKILDTCCEKDDNGGYKSTEDGTGFTIKPDHIDECSRKINELDQMDINMSYTQKLTLDELESLTINLEQMQMLMPFIQE